MAGPHNFTLAGLAVGLSMVAIASVLLLGAHESSIDEVKLSRTMSEDLLEMRKLPARCGHVKEIPPLAASDAKKWHLQHLSVLIRHGDRTRCSFQECWKNDTATFNCDLDEVQATTSKPRGIRAIKRPVLFRKTFAAPGNVLPGTCSLGQLTAVGRKQLLYTGRRLREAYKGFLPDKFMKDKFFLRACNEPRTLQSGEAFVEGMYPHLQSKQDESELVEFAVHDAVRDEMFPNFHVCPRLNRAVAEARATAKYKKHLKKVNMPLQKQIKKLLGYKHIRHINDCTTTHICHDQAVPDVLTSTMQKDIHKEVTSHYDIIAAATRKYAGGPLVGTLLDRLKSVISGSVPQKLDLYSGHDTGPILPLLHAFNVSDGRWPPYASTIVFELYESAKDDKAAKKENMVRMVYNGKILRIPGCDSALCPWSKFESIAAAVVPSKKDCVDKKMGNKMVHWDGMYSASFSTDLFGVNMGFSASHAETEL